MTPDTSQPTMKLIIGNSSTHLFLALFSFFTHNNNTNQGHHQPHNHSTLHYWFNKSTQHAQSVLWVFPSSVLLRNDCGVVIAEPCENRGRGVPTTTPIRPEINHRIRGASLWPRQRFHNPKKRERRGNIKTCPSNLSRGGLQKNPQPPPLSWWRSSASHRIIIIMIISDNSREILIPQKNMRKTSK